MFFLAVAPGPLGGGTGGGVNYCSGGFSSDTEAGAWGEGLYIYTGGSPQTLRQGPGGGVVYISVVSLS